MVTLTLLAALLGSVVFPGSSATPGASGHPGPPSPLGTSVPATPTALPGAAAAFTPPTLPGASLPQAAPADSLPSLSGTVRAEGYRTEGLLVGAVVQVRQGDRLRSTVVDVDGRYRLTDLDPGTAELAVHHIAAFPVHLELRLPNGGQMVLDLALERRVLPVAGIGVRALPGLNRPMRPLGSTDPRRVGWSMRALEASTGIVESGLASALPGEDDSASRGVLFMRGSTVDARVVFLDGAPILTPFHVAGLVEPFLPELVGDAQLYLGGAPSSYDGGVSYLLDVDTRVAGLDGVHGGLTLDGLNLRGFGELPLPMNGGLLVGGRTLHGMQGLLGEADRFPYLYDDLLIRGGVNPAEGHALRVTAFGNREGVVLDVERDSPAPAPEARWGNRALSLGYEGRVGDLRLEATAAGSRYSSSLPVRWADPVLARGTGERIRASGRGSLPLAGGSFRMGASTERLVFEYRLDSPRGQAVAASVSAGTEALATHVTGIFGEWEAWVGPEVRLRAGLRGERFAHEDRIRIAPRLGLRVLLGERAALTLSGGLYHQVLPAPGLRMEREGEGETSALDWDPSLPVASASHLVVGLEQELDGKVELGISGFVKGFSGFGSGGLERSRSSGTELRVGREGERFQGWLGYAISWFWTEEGMGGSTRFDGRHLLSVGMAGRIPGGMEVEGSLGYGAGLPLSAVEVFAEPGSLGGTPMSGSGDRERGMTPTTEARLNAGAGETPLELAPPDDFLRLDFQLGWPREVRVGGRTTLLRPYLKVLNALDRRDALFYYFDRWRGDEIRPLARRPFLPLAGVEWRF